MRIELRLTEHCNYNCSYCTDLHNNNTKDINIDFIGLINLIKEFNNPDIFIYGGEPTIHKDFNDLITALSQTVCTIIVQTNGSNPEIIKALDKSILINYSYHYENITLKKFISNISGTNINEIAYMNNNDLKDYHILKTIFKEKVQYCPLIDSSLDSKDFNVLPIPKEIFNSSDYHFTKHKSGLSNYDVWKDNLSNEGESCATKLNTIHIQDNYVYSCFNQMMKHESGISIREYQHSNELITCPNKKCYFGAEHWR